MAQNSKWFENDIKPGLKLLQCLYSKPVITAKQIQDHLVISHPTANALLKDFEKAKIVRELTGYRRNRMFEFRDYMDLFRK